MLSSVAERLYWMSRYLERSENVARLIQSYNHLIFDIPIGAEPDWFILIEVLDANETFNRVISERTEANVHRFLISRTTISNSITYSINSARENAEQLEMFFPRMYGKKRITYTSMLVKMHLNQSAEGLGLLFLEEIIKRLQALNGLMESSLLRDDAYRFISIGRKIERADMMARILKVAGGDIISRENQHVDLQPFLWGAVLDALYAKSAFRRIKGPVISKEQTLDFVLNSTDFPRSIAYCINDIDREVANLPENSELKKILRKQKKIINTYNVQNVGFEQIEKFNKEFQNNLIAMNKTLYKNWFDR